MLVEGDLLRRVGTFAYARCMGSDAILRGAAERVRVPLIERLVAVLGLGLAGFLGLLVWTILAHALTDPAPIWATPRYVKWGERVDAMAWISVAAAAAAWVTGMCLRSAVGIPWRPRPPGPWPHALRIAAIPTIMWLWDTQRGLFFRCCFCDPDGYSTFSRDEAFLFGLAMCALAGLELPGWVMHGVACLRARLPTFALPRTALDALPARGLVRVAGTVEAEGLDGDIVYRRAWNPQSRQDEIHGRPFQLRDRGHRVRVELHPDRAVVDALAQHGIEVRAGDHVEVIGHLFESADAGYRGGGRRIDAGPASGPGVLYVLGGSRQWNRRLLVAALVEFAAAAAVVLVAVPLLLLHTRLG